MIAVATDARVLNIRDLGRIGTWPADVRRIDRRSPYGNPFRISTGACTHPDCGPGSHPATSRDQAIAAYRRWLVGMLRVDPAFLKPLRGFRLACWCSPLACHGDVIAEALAAPSIDEWLAAA